jgi:hypothetical protein
MGDCEDGTWEHEDEESPLLEALVRGRLVKTKQAGKYLEGDVEFNGGAVITPISQLCASGQ